MDKVKQYLELARKHHFWILCAVAAIAGVVAWYVASGKLHAQFVADSGTIDQTLSSVSNVPAEQAHGDWTEGMSKETQALAKNVWNAWNALYQEQKEKVFLWPKNLSQDFLDATSGLEGPTPEMPRRLREYYQGMVRQQAVDLAKIVDAASLDE